MPERGNYELSNDHKRPGSAESSKLAQEALVASKPFWETTEFKKGTSEFVGTAVAGLTGTVGFAAKEAFKRNAVLKAASLCLAPVIGGYGKHLSKEGMDLALGLKGKEKTASDNDYWTGALDAVAGIAGSAAEKQVSRWYSGYLGRRELTRGTAGHAGGLKHEFACWLKSKPPTGIVSDKSAIAEGERILSQDLLPKITHNVLRGTAGGYAGSLTWSVPHRVVENAQQLNDDPGGGALKTIGQVGLDTTIGSAFGGATAGLITSALNGRQIARYWKARTVDEASLTRFDVAYINDAHSQTIGDRNFARAATKVNEIRDKSKALDTSTSKEVFWEDIPQSQRFSHWYKQFFGTEPTMPTSRSYRNSAFKENGDLENANVTSIFSGRGKAEDEIIRAMDPDGQPLGNHWPDGVGAKEDITTLPKYIQEQNIATGKKRPIIVGNQDYSELPKDAAQTLKDITEPYLIGDLKGPNGQPVKTATIGLVTEEGAVGGIKFQNPLPWVEDLADGTKIHHPGRVAEILAEIKEKHPDTKIFMIQSHLGDELDRKIAAHFKEISVIFGAHSHKAFGTPVWVNNGKHDVAILQAGAYLSHVGEANLAFNADGSLNRAFTKNQLHAITKSIKEDPIIDAIIKKNTPKELFDLANHKYDDATAIAKYTLDNCRRGENAMANLIVDALVAANKKLFPPGQRPQIVAVQSGFVRTGLPANQELTRLELCKTIINAGKPLEEVQEQMLANITGKQYKDILEFGIADLSPQAMLDDPQGNLLHFNGTYTVDYTKPVGQRVSNIKLFGEDDILRPLDFDQTYLWQNRWHFIDKAHKAGALCGDMTKEDMYKSLNVTAFKESVVDALGEFITGKTLDPKAHTNLGRIIDATRSKFTLQFGQGLSIPSFSLLAGRDTMSGDQKAH